MKVQTTKSFSTDFGVKILIYGPSGAGKTYAASTLQGFKPVIISAESGTLSLRKFDIPMIDIAKDDSGKPVEMKDRIARLLEVFKFLKLGQHPFDTIYLDSLTEVSQCLMAYLKNKYPDKKDSLPMYGENAEVMMKIIREFRDLKYNVIVTALSSIDKDDVGRRFSSPDVVGKVSQNLPQLFDEVFYLHHKQDESGNMVRKFQTVPTEGIASPKDRSGILESFEEIKLGEIINRVRATIEVPKPVVAPVPAAYIPMKKVDLINMKRVPVTK